MSVIQLPSEQYEGQPCFLLLPNRDLTDEELLAKGGFYATLYNSQFEDAPLAG